MQKQRISIFLVITLLIFTFPQLTFFGYAVEPQPENAWNSLYFDYIVQDKADSENSADWKWVTYELIYLNDDTIPELWITYQYSFAGCRLVTIADGAIAQESLRSGYLSYNEYLNAFFHSAGKMDVYYDTVYKLENGSLVTVAEGRSEVTWSSDGSSCSTDYYWNDMSFTEQEYAQIRNTLVSDAELQVTNSEESTQYSYDDILYYLATVEIIVETEPPSTTPSEEDTAETTEPDVVALATEQTESLHTESPDSSSADCEKNNVRIWILGGMILCNIILIIVVIKRFCS